MFDYIVGILTSFSANLAENIQEITGDNQWGKARFREPHRKRQEPFSQLTTSCIIFADDIVFEVSVNSACSTTNRRSSYSEESPILRLHNDLKSIAKNPRSRFSANAIRGFHPSELPSKRTSPASIRKIILPSQKLRDQKSKLRALSPSCLLLSTASQPEFVLISINFKTHLPKASFWNLVSSNICMHISLYPWHEHTYTTCIKPTAVGNLKERPNDFFWIFFVAAPSLSDLHTTIVSLGSWGRCSRQGRRFITSPR